MKAITQSDIISTISGLNTFAESAESLIGTTQAAYASEKKALLNRQHDVREKLDRTYEENCSAVERKSRQTIEDAKKILSDISVLDESLSNVDKYYVMTKEKKGEILESIRSDDYYNATDYFKTLKKIKESYNSIYLRYAVDILPGLFNGLNFLFSSQRKKDYQELIVLKNTVEAFVNEINDMLPSLTEDNLAALKDEYLKQRDGLLSTQKNEVDAFEGGYSATLEKVAEKILADLENTLPDEFVNGCFLLSENFENAISKINTTRAVQDEVLNMCYIEYPVDYFVQSKIVASIIKDKCVKLMANGSIRLPFIMSINDASAWTVVNNGSNSAAVQAFTHSIMYSFLSLCPAGQLTYTIIDPKGSGNSIRPFSDIKERLPELFGERISVSNDEIADTIRRLNSKIISIEKDRLGGRYSNISDYAKNTPNYVLDTELVVLYDFPNGFDEMTLAELRNILKNGSKCGVFVIISYTQNEDNSSASFCQGVQSIIETTTIINQMDEVFSLRGLLLDYHAVPRINELEIFVNKYLLMVEGIRDRGIVSSSIIKELIESRDAIELDSCIARICEMKDNYVNAYGKVPAANAVFPSLVMLGNALYPADVFSDSSGYQRIVEKFGTKQISNMKNTAFIELPLVFDLRNSFNVFLSSAIDGGDDVINLSHHIIWSFLSLMPATKVDVCVFDGEQRGNSIAPFLDFRKRSPETFDNKIYTNQESMYERLQKLDAQIDDFILEKLGNRFSNIIDYNLNAPKRAESVTLLVIYDFPSGMDGRSIDLLTSILRNGSKCGVYTVICHNPNITFSRYESIDERIKQIMKQCVSLDCKEGAYYLMPYNLNINTPGQLSLNDADKFINEYINRSERISKKAFSFKDIISNDLFSCDSSKSMSIPVGIGDGDSIVSVNIGKGSSHHGLIAGATGSGKSTLLHTMIMSSMLHYSPDQLNLYLMDFKSGTEFKVYETVRLPHIQLLALDAMQEFGESILEKLVAEMDYRSSLYKEVNQTGLDGYTQATGRTLPRILVVMDEFQILFNDSTNRKVAANCAELAKRIVTEGRAFGVHLFMATQSTKVISDLAISHGTIEQMRIRIGLKCGENDARYLFSDKNDEKAMEMMKGPIGTAVMNPDYTDKANIGFRAAYCDDETQKFYLDLISKKFAHVPYKLQTFEGGRTTSLIDYFEEAHISGTSELPVKIHMGTLIKVAPPFAIVIDKKMKHNLLVCGSNEKMANTVSNNYIISALINKNATVYCIDGDKLVGDDASADFYNSLAGSCERFKVAQDRADIIRFINEVYQNYLARKKQNANDVIFVVIKNLQFLDIIKSMFKGDTIDESEYVDSAREEPTDSEFINPFADVVNYFENKGSGDDASVGEKLLKMIHDGSGFGIHFVVTSLEYQTVRECMYYGENILTKFPERIIFSLGAGDADNLIENVSVAGLRDNTVYFTDGVKKTFQMKPYITPKANEVSKLLN